MAFVVKNVYFLAVHAPCDEPGAPAPVNGLIVHAAALLHPDLPQPDAALMYRCLTEFPGRTPGCLVPLSTLGCELGGGSLWRNVADWPRVLHALAALARAGIISRLPLALTPAESALLTADPHAPAAPGHGTQDRHQLLYSLTARLTQTGGRPPSRPDCALIQPPQHPAVMPYQSHGT
jgi:hypothetical protein